MGKLKRKEWLKTTKKMLSVALLSALVVTTIPTVQADAAAKPKLNKKKVTIRVGKKYTLKVVNKIKGSKYTWKSNKKKVAAVTKKGAVKGKKKGNAIITCTVKAPSKTYKLTCNVKVKKAAKTTKPTPTPTVNTSATVSTQSELESALKNEALTSILLKTDAESKFTIPAGTYSKKTLTVNAPNADVENEGVFKEVKIQEIKASTWTEKAKGNILRLLDKSIRVIIAKTAQVKEIITEGSDASVNLEVEGTLTKLTIKKKTKIEVKGSNKEAIPVEVTSEGKDTELISEVPVNVALNADTEVTLKKGAEESKVEKKVDSIKIVVENQTSVTITITTPSGNQTVSAGSKVTSEAKGDTTTTTPGTSGGGGGGGSASKPDPTPSDPSNTENPTEASMTVKPSVVSGDVTITDKKIEVSGTDIVVQFDITVTNPTDGTINVTSGSGIALTDGTVPIQITKDFKNAILKFTIRPEELNNSTIIFNSKDIKGITEQTFTISKKGSDEVDTGFKPYPVTATFEDMGITVENEAVSVVSKTAIVNIPKGTTQAAITITGTVTGSSIGVGTSVAISVSGSSINSTTIDKESILLAKADGNEENKYKLTETIKVNFTNEVGDTTFNTIKGLELKIKDNNNTEHVIGFVEFKLKTN